MDIRFVSAIPSEGAFVCVVKEGGKLSQKPFIRVLEGVDQAYIKSHEAHGLWKAGVSRRLILPSGREVVVLGVSASQAFTHRHAIRVMRRMVTYARKEQIKNIILSLDDMRGADFKDTREALASVLAIQCELANFEFTRYKTLPSSEGGDVEVVSIYAESYVKGIADALKRGKIIGEETNEARILSNTPGGDMTPSVLAEAAERAGARAGFSVNILHEPEIRKIGMGGVLGVSQGSSASPKFIVMEYRKGKRSEKPVVLVGKGVTFDTGGLNLKPEDGIYEMHMDMSGGAAVIHVIAALARMGVKRNIIGLVPAVENMPSGSSYRPGDILKTLSGKTIEVLNTDAEGRIILADALEYAKRYDPRLVIDIATLTGAAVVALGQWASALFSTDEAVGKKMHLAGELSGDYVWPLPIWSEFEEEIKGTFGDIANTGKTHYGGAIRAAVFLWQFIKGFRWVHIDIAPRMTSVEGEYLAKGAVGASVPLLSEFLRKF